MQKCPHFDSCDSVRCPLDQFMKKRVKLPEDNTKCRLRRSERIKIGQGMRTKGLTPNEIAALKRTYGSMEKGIRAILNKNFNRKNRKPSHRR